MMGFISTYTCTILLLITSLVDILIAPPIPERIGGKPCPKSETGELISCINNGYQKHTDELVPSYLPEDYHRPRRSRRNAWNRNDWPKSDDGLIYIPYKVRDSYTALRVNENLAKATKEFEKHTCFRLIEWTDQTDYVDIHDDQGCWTYVSQIGGRQPMSLSDGCEEVAIILHEFMHVIGFFHEQERQDRDEHIYLNWTNIYPDAVPQFKVKPGFVHGKDYDIHSIMHYGRKAAAIDRNYDAMTPLLQPNATLGAPLNSSFSPGDILGLKLKSLCEVDVKVYGGPYATREVVEEEP